MEPVIRRDWGPTMNDIAVYMNAVAAIEELCFMDQDEDLRDEPPRAWSLPKYDLSFDIWTREVRFAVWALPLTVGASRHVGYWPISDIIRLRGAYEGRVNIQYRRLSNSSTITGNPGDQSLNSSAANVPTKTNELDVALAAGQLRVIPRYNGAPMSTHDVFTRALNAMVQGAENGPNAPCNGIPGVRGFDITPERDEQGQSLLKYRQVIKAMRILTRWMVAMERFGEIDFVLEGNGVIIARGRIQNYQSQSLASQ